MSVTSGRPALICNCDFHTSIGGFAQTLVTILPILARHYALCVVDPYRNAQFGMMLAQRGLHTDTVVDLSHKPSISIRTGISKRIDWLVASPRYFWTALQLRRYFVRRHVDLVYVSQPKSALMAVLATPLGVPIIYHCHGVTASGIGLVLRVQGRLARIVANSPFTQGKLVEMGFDSTRIVTIENTISVDDIRTKAEAEPATTLPATGQRPVILLAHAGIEPNKGTHLAIEALGELKTGGLPGELWITGDVSPANEAYAMSIKALVARLELGARVHFLGSRTDIYPVMARSDIVVVPSLIEESFGLVAVEALALGKAVVVSNRGALLDSVEDGVTGRVFDPDVPGALATVLADLVQNPRLGQAYGAAGLRLTNARFSMLDHERRLVSLFSQVLGLHPLPGPSRYVPAGKSD